MVGQLSLKYSVIMRDLNKEFYLTSWHQWFLLWLKSIRSWYLYWYLDNLQNGLSCPPLYYLFCFFMNFKATYLKHMLSHVSKLCCRNGKCNSTFWYSHLSWILALQEAGSLFVHEFPWRFMKWVSLDSSALWAPSHGG